MPSSRCSRCRRRRRRSAPRPPRPRRRAELPGPPHPAGRRSAGRTACVWRGRAHGVGWCREQLHRRSRGLPAYGPFRRGGAELPLRWLSDGIAEMPKSSPENRCKAPTVPCPERLVNTNLYRPRAVAAAGGDEFTSPTWVGLYGGLDGDGRAWRIDVVHDYGAGAAWKSCALPVRCCYRSRRLRAGDRHRRRRVVAPAGSAGGSCPRRIPDRSRSGEGRAQRRR